MVMKMKNSTSETTASKLDRRTVEKNRRIHMKGLCFKLASLVPSHHSKVMLTQQDQLDLAASYITQLRERIDKLKKRKEQAMMMPPPPAPPSISRGISSSTNNMNNRIRNDIVLDHAMRPHPHGMMLPVIELKDMGCSIEVVLISGLHKNFMLYEIISVLEQEGAEVVSASLSVVDDKIFHTLHAQVKLSRVGVETSRVWQRLQDLIY
ncbi:transcription factor bHLH162-like [Humulus lupulus]|uniref:transcription factor bHLH162-like n=1 Tax=Humulus lupulus TaxID=3486 RepID=UPI002B4149B2|nr:transcription factor bHLH162-like [Humulus lupulus]